MVRRLAALPLAKLLSTVGAVLVSLLILGGLLYRERAVLFQTDWHLDPLVIGSVFLLYLIGLTLAALIWAQLMQSLGSALPFLTHLQYYFVAHLARRLPGSIWYIVGRGYLYNQTGESLRLVTFASSVEIFIMVVSGSITSLLFAGYSLSIQTAFPLWGWALLSVAGLLLLHPRALQYLMGRFKLVERSRLRYRDLFTWLFLFSLIWIIGGIVLYLISSTVTTVAFGNLPYFIGSWSLIGTLSFVILFLPSNLGFTEVGLSLLLSTVVPSSLAVIIAVANRILLLLCDLVGIPGLVILVRFLKSREVVKP